MPRGRKSVDPELTALATDPTNQLVRTLEGRMPSSRTKLKASTFNGDGEVEPFVELFEEVSEANGWSDREALLYLCSCLR